MRKIFKYILPVQDVVEIEMPSNPVILDIKAQDGKICLWAIVYAFEWAEMTKKIFHIFGTGHELPNNTSHLYYRGTVQLDGLVWHIFEKLN